MRCANFCLVVMTMLIMTRGEDRIAMVTMGDSFNFYKIDNSTYITVDDVIGGGADLKVRKQSSSKIDDVIYTTLNDGSWDRQVEIYFETHQRHKRSVEQDVDYGENGFLLIVAVNFVDNFSPQGTPLQFFASHSQFDLSTIKMSTSASELMIPTVMTSRSN